MISVVVMAVDEQTTDVEVHVAAVLVAFVALMVDPSAPVHAGL